MSATRTRYPLHDASGALVATHIRVDGPAKLGELDIAEGDKVVYWVNAEGKKGLDAPIQDLPPYGIDKVGAVPGVIITEGEKAAQALLDAGIPAVGTVCGSSTVPSPASLGDLTGKHVILWPDNDDVGIDHMLAVAENLKGIAVTTRWVTWPDAQPKDDAYDCIERHGKDRVRELLKLAGPVPESDMTFARVGLGYTATFRKGKVTMAMTRLRARSGALQGELLVRSDDPKVKGNGHLLQGEFNASAMGTRSSLAKDLAARAPMLKVEWRDMLEAFCVRILAAEREGLPFTTVGARPPRETVPYLLHPILPLNRPTIVFGAGGSGKSSFAVACAVAVASGKAAIPGWEPLRKGRVLVLDWEADEDEWNDRVAAIAKGMGLDEPLEIHYRPCITPITDQVDDVARFVREQGIDLIIVDSVGMASPGTREGSDANEGVIKLFQALRVIGVTSLLVDHVNKTDKRSDKGSTDPYGSIFKSNLARQTFELRREDDDEAAADDPIGHVALINRKVNAGPKRKPYGLRIEYRDDGAMLWRREDVRDSMQQSLPTMTRILDYLRAGPKTPKEIAEALDINPNTVRPTLSRAVDSGRALAFADGRYALAQREEPNAA